MGHWNEYAGGSVMKEIVIIIISNIAMKLDRMTTSRITTCACSMKFKYVMFFASTMLKYTVTTRHIMI